MKNLFKLLMMCFFLTSSLLYLSGCDDDDDPEPQLTGESESFDLTEVSDSNVGGTVTFAERDDDQILVTLQLTGTQSGNSHPASINVGTAAEGGDVVLVDLTDVDGATGKSETVVKALADGTPLAYADLPSLDAFVRVDLSAADMETVIAHGDIGQNELTTESTVYTFEPGVDDAITGTATFTKRKNGTTLVTVEMENVPDGVSHNSHIHVGTIAEGGTIVIPLEAVVGPGGKAQTTVRKFNEAGGGGAVTYDELLQYNGHLNVHAAGGGYLGQVDIGQNELTAESKVYTFEPGVDDAITGTATFTKRKNGTTLVTVEMENVPDGVSHNSHIHVGTIAEGGSIVIPLEAVVGPGGKAETTVRAFNATGGGGAVTYDELLEYNGHLNVHAVGGGYLGQVDIGQNELTAESKVYTFEPGVDVNITGTATFTKRKNGTTLVTVEMENVPDGVSHNSHIHVGTIAEGGSIVIPLEAVVGPGGKAETTVKAFNATGGGGAVTYDELLNYNGHLNVHAVGGGYLGQVDIGQNELTGDKKVYTLNPVSNPDISGTATFAKRKNGTTLVTVALTGTTAGNSHASHIHENSAAEGGGIKINLTNVDGATGMAQTSVRKFNDTVAGTGAAITYDELLTYDGHLNVHISGGLIAQGDIGSNVP